MIAAAESFGPLAREHLARPRNHGPFAPDAPGSVRSGEAGSRSAGAFVRFHLRIEDGCIVAARYEVLGAPALIAACSYLSELLQGAPASPQAMPRGLDLARALALPRAEHGAALLAEDAARAALTA
ncbi:MAG TPA: iron-sulfur cluster assembly scaffold protein [Gammaproteobacteria bacterium]|nr:iron-sulfur cluster assembly scaffold protein [Gammaproteobacteria bacterium]